MKTYLAGYILICTIFVLGITPNVQAAFINGDIFAAIGVGAVERYNAAGVLQETLNTSIGGAGTFTTGMAFDSADNLYVTNFSSDNITRFDNTSTIILPNPFVGNDPNAHNESIVFDAAGNFYIGQPDGTQDIIKRAANGSFLARYDVPIEAGADTRGSDWLDLAADGKTMYYTSEGRKIQRYDVSTDSALADFAVLGGTTPTSQAFALRLLNGGGMLVADKDNVKRLNAAGTVIDTYDVSGEDTWFSLNVDPDGTSFWSGNFLSGKLYKFDIATGSGTDNHSQTITTGAADGFLRGVTVFGETTVISDPLPIPASIWLFGSGLIGLASVARRRRS